MNEGVVTMTNDFDFSIYSDMYKDVYGFRPRDFNRWISLTNEERNQELDRLQNSINEDIKREREFEVLTISTFEDKIADLIALGADSRETAIRWYIDGSIEDDHNDWDYVLYRLNLPTWKYCEEFKSILAR